MSYKRRKKNHSIRIKHLLLAYDIADFDFDSPIIVIISFSDGKCDLFAFFLFKSSQQTSVCDNWDLVIWFHFSCYHYYLNVIICHCSFFAFGFHSIHLNLFILLESFFTHFNIKLGQKSNKKTNH